jgi:hyperosmotically inducible protein
MKTNNKLSLVYVVCLALALTMFMGACKSTQTAGEQLDDAGITAQVKAKLAADGDINPFNIDVDTVDGVVTLNGKVAKAEAKTKAGQLARETDGVRRVNNLIQVGDSSM